MPGTNYTTNLRLANPSLNDTGWGTTVSSGMIDLTDQAIAGLATADVTSSDVTLTIVDGSAGTNSARNMFLNITGTPGVARDVIVPTNRKLYFVTNNCGQIATVKVSGQPGVAVPAGASMTLRINAAGTDVAPTFTYAASMSLGTALPATSGGTGQSSFAIGDLLYASSTTAISKLTVGATNAVLTVAAGIPTWTPTLSAVSGGTGQSSFAVGDLLYASSTTAISKLTVGATNAVLTVAAGIPSWTATLPVASGGTGAATLAANNVLLGNGTSAVQTVAPGASGNVLTSNGTIWQSTAPAAGYIGPNAQFFTANGTFTIPTGITRLIVTVVGAGGGAGAGYGGGGAGGVAIKVLSSLTPGNTLSVTVGAGGAGTGGNSSVASGTQTITTITGNGGSAGGANVITGGGGGAGEGGAGGSASNGDANFTGQKGGVGLSGTFGCGTYVIYGDGGAGPFGQSGGNGNQNGRGGVVLFQW